MDVFKKKYYPVTYWICSIELDIWWSKSIKNEIYSYLPTTPLGQDMTQGQFLSEV